MIIGYARISTAEQVFDLQLDALKAAGVQQVYKDTASGAKTDRPGLEQLMSVVRPGDIVVVWKLDRLGRSLKHLINLIDEFHQRGINFRSLSEGIDTRTPAGKMVFQIFGAVAEFERSLIVERTNAGLSAARSRGKSGGRPKGLTKKAEQTSHIAASLYQERKLSTREICEQLNISSATLYRYLRARGLK